jgi:hypothetical protein
MYCREESRDIEQGGQSEQQLQGGSLKLPAKLAMVVPDAVSLVDTRR